MVDLEDISVASRGDGTEHPTNEYPPMHTGKNVRRGRRKNSGSFGSGNGPPSEYGRDTPEDKIPRFSDSRNQIRGDSNVDGNGKKFEQPGVGQGKGSPPTEDHRARFYETYNQEAEDYDREFVKRYEGDLNTTLIFAGLFSVVTSVFIIEINSELKPDPTEETAALLRVLIHKLDNSTFGDVPTVPQWTGPPRTIVDVQAILFASLGASIFSAFFAMLGKQWLSRYESVTVRGSAVERGQNRQQQLDGIATWYFAHVMESLPLMLQTALLLHGCALSRYLWDINTTVASVVLGTTSFGVLSYLFILVAGTVSVNCPYQTPGAYALRHTISRISQSFSTLHSIFSNSVERSLCRITLNDAWGKLTNAPHTATNTNLALLTIFLLPVWFLADVCRAIVWLLVRLFRGERPRSRRTSEHPTTVLDLRCISWTLQKSLDAPARLSTLNHLATTTLANFDTTLVTDCFGILISCLNVINNKATVTQGTEPLARAATLCYLRTVSHLTVMDPMALESVRQQYDRAFPPETDFNAIQFAHALGPVHRILHPDSRFPHWRFPQWEDYKPSGYEHAIVARALTKIAWFWRQEKIHEKVPCCLLRFVLHSLSLSPLPSTSVVADCLSIIAIDLGCGPQNTTTFDESVPLDDVSFAITQKLESMAEDPDPVLINSKRKAISALFPYAVFLEQGGQRRMVDAISNAAKATRSRKFMWYRAKPFITAMFNKPNPPSLSWILGLVSPRVHWDDGVGGKGVIAKKAAATLETSQLDEDGWTVSSGLTRVGFIDPLHPDLSHGLPWEPESREDLTDRVRALGDVEILKSYLFLVWSKRGPIDDDRGGLAEMRTLLQEDVSGIEMGHHREELVERLDHVLQGLDGSHRVERREGLCGGAAQLTGHCEEFKEGAVGGR